MRLKHFMMLKNYLLMVVSWVTKAGSRSWEWCLGPKQALQTSKHSEKVVIMAPLIGKLRLGSRSGFESELRMVFQAGFSPGSLRMGGVVHWIP